MEAGRELDALVSQHVMRNQWDESRCRVCGWPLATAADEGCTADSCSMRPKPERRADEPAPYSTEIAAAWQVVETLAAQNWTMSLGWKGADRVYANTAEVVFQQMGSGDYRTAHAVADTAPLAICIAALRALGVEV